jgi:hypothetical protein
MVAPPINVPPLQRDKFRMQSSGSLWFVEAAAAIHFRLVQ